MKALYHARPVCKAEEEEVVDRLAAAGHRLQHFIGQHAAEHRTYLHPKQACGLHHACCSLWVA